MATALTASGGYKYTAQVELSESGGVAATIKEITLAADDGWGGTYEPFGRFVPETLGAESILPAHGNWTSPPLVATIEAPEWYYSGITATVRYTDNTSAALRVVALTASSPPMPEPPADARFTLTGTVTGLNDKPVPEATIEVLTGADVKRKAKADADGRYTLTGLKTGTFVVAASKTGYVVSPQTVQLKSNLTMRFWLAPG